MRSCCKDKKRRRENSDQLTELALHRGLHGQLRNDLTKCWSNLLVKATRSHLMSEGDIGFCSLLRRWRLHIGCPPFQLRGLYRQASHYRHFLRVFWKAGIPLRLGLAEKKKVMDLKVSIKFRTLGTLLQLATMAKMKAMASAVQKKTFPWAFSR